MLLLRIRYRSIDDNQYVRLGEGFHEIQRAPGPRQILGKEISDVSLYRKMPRRVDSRACREHDNDRNDPECMSRIKIDDPDNRCAQRVDAIAGRLYCFIGTRVNSRGNRLFSATAYALARPEGRQS